MTKLRVVAGALVALALVVLLLDWTLGALDALYIGRLADVRQVRAAMEVLPDGALAMRPDVRLHLADGAFTIRTDRSGFRVPAERTAGPPPAGSTVAVLGDGAAFGWSVEESLAFPRRLEPRLADAGRPAVIVNAGQLFASPRDLVTLLEHRVLPRDPDLVVVCGPVSDGVLPEEWRAIAADEARDRSWSERFLPSIHAVVKRLASGPPQRMTAPLDQEQWLDALRAVRSRCAEHGVPCVAVDLGADGFRTACVAADVDCIDASIPRQRLAALTTDGSRRFPDVAGHALVADRLAAALASRVPPRGH